MQTLDDRRDRMRAKAAAGLQYAALPFNWSDGLQILLVTSRETGRWVLPKGWPMARRKPHDAAAREAMEEAGVIGKVGKTAIGSYRYVKRLRHGEGVDCEVKIFPLKVGRQLKHWREQHQRIARWFAPEAAALAVQEPDLAELIKDFAAAAKPPRKTAGRVAA